MGTVNMYRYFDQKIEHGVRPYKRLYQKLTKAEADSRASRIRKNGNKARIIKESDGWVVFALMWSESKERRK